MKKLLAISGSPRRMGNTELLLEEVIRAAKEAGVEAHKLVVHELNISPCNSCGRCRETGECVIADEMQGVYQKLLEADYIVVASPLYFMGISAQLKALIDRCQALWARRYVLGQPLRNSNGHPKGLFLSTAAMEKGDGAFRGAISTVKALFHVLDVEYKGELLFCGLEEKGEVKKHPEFMEKAYKAARHLVED